MLNEWYEYNQHEQNGNWSNINSTSSVIQWRWHRFTCIQESIGQGGLESDVTHGQRPPHRVVEGVPGVVRVQLVLGGFEERQYVLPAPTSILFEMRTIFWRCQQRGCHLSPNNDTRVFHLFFKSTLMVDNSSLNYVRVEKHDWVSSQSKNTNNTKVCLLGFYRQRDYLFLYLDCLCAPKHRSPHDRLWRTTSRSQWTHRPPPGRQWTDEPSSAALISPSTSSSPTIIRPLVATKSNFILCQHAIGIDRFSSLDRLCCQAQLGIAWFIW